MMKDSDGPKNLMNATDEEVEAFLGPVPKSEDLPDWLREAIPEEDGGLGVKEKASQEVEKVRVPTLLRRYSWLHGAVYGLLLYHSLSADGTGRPQTWVSVTRLAEEAGCTPQWVDRILRELEQTGMIKTEFRPGQSNIYTLLLPSPKVVGWVYHLREKKSELFVGI